MKNGRSKVLISLWNKGSARYIYQICFYVGLKEGIKEMLRNIIILKAGLLFMLFMLVVVTQGCARTMTDKFDSGSELFFTINYNGPITTTTANYYVIFPQPEATLGSVIPDKDGIDSPYPFFDAPHNNNLDFRDRLNDFYLSDELGLDPIAYYFQHYYQNWFDYIEVDGSEVKLNEGPFPADGTITTNIQTSTIGSIDNNNGNVRLSFTVRIDQLSHPYARGENIRFFIVTGTGDFLLADWMNSISYISNEQGNSVSGVDDEYSQNDALTISGLDIVDWNVIVR
ncbi:MAG: hypothetical protein DKM50_12475 [Candidatus Margulisiibacteriota bacterium]|nr:MAG: hypothetical protein A2X43_09160 [Candidatus Margulisbacteria bacterium GWD2_39_127]OGI11094.1 MAG: hypothetical protein A2X41_02295 [Candidatus Margulisbacteria bacterium GWE2_39_32]PZM78158.1 MAG: hypothetical protein DKM50_12475 [Candidatus Margulisiibacteriota bacterium]HAR62306.1 hypothetical protein [Candidatus Margulisiibacteriota bacterium]HCY37939.1 hypothetical protein [Candidatus Margulisiibacteriota bacterium]